MIVLALIAVAASCPFPADQWTTIATKRELPPAAAAAFGEMAEKDQPFQVSDVVLSGHPLPFSRFVSARGHGCDLILDYEHGGRAHSWKTAHLRFGAGRWVVDGR